MKLLTYSLLAALTISLSACAGVHERLYTLETNYVAQIVVSNGVATTNWLPTGVTLTPKPEVEGAIKEVGGAVGGFWGLGGIVSTVLVGLYHLYASVRNKKVRGALVQGIEVARELIKTTPLGHTVDASYKEWLIKSQQKENVLPAVTKAVEESVDTGEAKDTASAIKEKATTVPA